MPISDEKQSHSKPLSSEEVEKFLKFTMKDIDNQLRHKQMYLSSFLGQMETLLNTKENSKVMEKDKLTCQIKHFAQLIRSAGSFQGQIHLSYLVLNTPFYLFIFSFIFSKYCIVENEKLSRIIISK